jgi:hypothetical protein
MKKLILLCCILIPWTLNAQTIIFSENFETVSLPDSVTSSGTPNLWANSTHLFHNGARSDSNKVTVTDTSYLTTSAFNTTGNSFVILQFSHICKIELLDAGEIEVSANGGPWVKLTGTEYIDPGNSQFINMGNKFNSNTYPVLWASTAPNTVPTNAWWMTEQFNISALVGNSPNVKIRFVLRDGNANGTGGCYGWFLDDIRVIMSFSELNPPTISYIQPQYVGTIYNLGPFNVRATVDDVSGIQEADLFYKVNGGPIDSVIMSFLGGDSVQGSIPAVNDLDTVKYYIRAYDASPAHNSAINPTSGFRSFVARTGITFPFADNFDGASILFYDTTMTPGTQWELGTPAYGTCNSAHSAPNAWDINLTSAYGTYAVCYLYTPIFDFSSTANAKLSFWINYSLESGCDGIRVEYTTDGTTWATLGTVGSPNAVNWYNSSSVSSSSSNPVWTGSSGGWIKCEYLLTQLNYIAGPTQLRFTFTSDVSISYDGVSIDDFAIIPPFGNDAGAISILQPDMSGCVAAGNNTFRAIFKNLGSNKIAPPLSISYQVDAMVPVSDNWNDTIYPGEQDTITFSTPLNVGAGNHTLHLYTSLAGDQFTLNDTIVNNFLAFAPLALPYFNFLDSAGALNDFCIQTGTYGRAFYSTLAANTGTGGVILDATNSTGWTYPDTIVGSIYYIWDPNIDIPQQSILRLNLNSLGYNNLTLKFDAKLIYLWGDDYTNFRVTVNGTMITPHMRPAGSTTAYNTFEYDLSSFLPSPVLTIEFQAKNYASYNYSSPNGSATFLDNIKIFEPPAQEASMLSMTLPAGGCGLGMEQVTVQFKNTGLNSITGNLNAVYKVNNGAAITPEPISTTILPGDTLDYTFITNLDMSVTTTDSIFNIKAWVELTGDPFAYNDTVTQSVKSKHTPTDPLVSNITIPYGTSATLMASSPDSVYWYAVPVGGTSIGSHHNYTTPVLYGQTVYYTEASTSNPGFYINNLLATGSHVVDQMTNAGDDRGGIAITQNYYYLNGDNNAVRFDMPNLTNPVSLPISDGMFSDLAGSGTLYTLWNGTAGPAGTSLSSAYNVTSIRTLNNDLTLGSTTIMLSQPIVMGTGNSSAIFSGEGFAILYNSSNGVPANTFYRIDIPSGIVTVLGTYTLTAIYTENWARWGIAEANDDVYSVIYVNSSTSISRLNLSTGAVSTVATFSNLSDMASITYSPWNSRWYFHHEYGSQFGGVDETAGYADAVATSNLGCSSARVPDTVFVSGTPLCDVGVQVIYSPVSGYVLTNNEIVSARIKNYGSAAVTNIPINFTVNGGSLVTEIIPGPIASGDTLHYTFTVGANLSTTGTYTVAVFTTLSCDTISVNDSLSKVVVNNPLVYCPSQASSTGDEEIFSVTFNGSTNAYNCTTIAPGPGSVLNSYSNFTTLPPLTSFVMGSTVTFTIQEDECDGASYYNNGAAVWIDFNHNGSFLDTGEQVYSESSTTVSPRTINGNFVVPVGTFIGVTTMRITVAEGYSGSSLTPCLLYGYGETEDYSVLIGPLLHKDPGVIGFVSPSTSESQGVLVPIDIKLKNCGLDTLTAVDLSWTANASPVQTLNWSGILPPGQIDTVHIGNFLMNTGMNNVMAYCTLSGDSNTYNDTTRTNCFGLPPMTIFLDDFEATTSNWTTNPSTLWQHGVPASTVINTSHSPTKCWKTNLIGNYSDNREDFLYSPAFNFSNLTGMVLRFWQWWEAEPLDGGNLQYSYNGTTWITLGLQNDPNGVDWYNTFNNGKVLWTGNFGGWRNAIYDLSQFNNKPHVLFRFYFYTNTSVSNYNGWAVDDFEIRVPKLPYDAGVVAITEPAPLIPGGLVHPKVTIHNYGIDTLITVPVAYVLSGGGFILENWTGVLPPDSNANFSFTNSYISPTGSYTFCSFTGIPTDNYRFNDSTCVYVTNSIGVEDFESLGFMLGQNIPNPAGEMTRIPYFIPESGTTRFTIENIVGQLLYTENISNTAGNHEITIDISHFTTGLYFYSLEYSGRKITKKMLIER